MASVPVDLEWPYPERRNPHPSDPDYLGARGLSRFLQQAIATELVGLKDLDIVDVGCGRKPFYPFLAPYSRSYTGTDIIADSPLVDRVCPSEQLDLPDACADLVLCLSVLEHVNDPIQSVKELARVVRPNGVVFASTHGCFPWHPYPQDHWRWTQTGLPILFRQHGGFTRVRLHATRGSMSGIFFLLAHYVYNWASQKPWRLRFRSLLTRSINRIGQRIDERTPTLKNPERHVTAIPEFFVIARK